MPSGNNYQFRHNSDWVRGFHQRLLSNKLVPVALLTWKREEYSRVTILTLCFDWSMAIGESSDSSTRICRKGIFLLLTIWLTVSFNKETSFCDYSRPGQFTWKIIDWQYNPSSHNTYFLLDILVCSIDFLRVTRYYGEPEGRVKIQMISKNIHTAILHTKMSNKRINYYPTATYFHLNLEKSLFSKLSRHFEVVRECSDYWF